MLLQPGKHRRSFSSGKNGQGGDLAAAAARAVQSVESGGAATPAQIASVFGGASGRSTTDGLYPVLDFEQVCGAQAEAVFTAWRLMDACARVALVKHSVCECDGIASPVDHQTQAMRSLVHACHIGSLPLSTYVHEPTRMLTPAALVTVLPVTCASSADGATANIVAEG